MRRAYDLGNMFSLEGTLGELVCDADTGVVMEYWPTELATDLAGYFNISQVDVAEWRRAHFNRVLAGGLYDIADFGLVYRNGVVAPVHPGYRDSVVDPSGIDADYDSVVDPYDYGRCTDDEDDNEGEDD